MTPDYLTLKLGPEAAVITTSRNMDAVVCDGAVP